MDGKSCKRLKLGQLIYTEMKKMSLPLILLACSFFAFQHFKTDPVLDFLKSLDQDQKAKAQMPFDDLSRNDWHFFPGEMWPREGIQIQELNGEQKELLHKLLQHFLSKTGYNKTMKIIDLEKVLAEIENNSTFRNPEKYYIAFYGHPERDSLWAWSFEGHHISLNFTVLNEQISIAPRFFGANPAIIKEGKRKGERTLVNEEDKGLGLINSLSMEQKKQAVFQKTSFKEIVTSVASEVAPLDPVGIPMKELDQSQQMMLLDLIDEYLSTMPEPLAEKRSNNLKEEEMEEIRFGWAGATELGKPHYYRIQGKTFLVEFDNTQNNANHIHTVWRDFDGDFGRDLIKEHYQHSNHH